MTFEARLAFVIAFLIIWCIAGLVPWATAAVVTRGRGAALALPLCLLAACGFGIAVPVLGARDSAGFFVSLGTAFVGSTLAAVAGTALGRRMERERAADFEPGSLPRQKRDRPPGASVD